VYGDLKLPVEPRSCGPLHSQRTRSTAAPRTGREWGPAASAGPCLSCVSARPSAGPSRETKKPRANAHARNQSALRGLDEFDLQSSLDRTSEATQPTEKHLPCNANTFANLRLLQSLIRISVSRSMAVPYLAPALLAHFTYCTNNSVCEPVFCTIFVFEPSLLFAPPSPARPA